MASQLVFASHIFLLIHLFWVSDDSLKSKAVTDGSRISVASNG